MKRLLTLLFLLSGSLPFVQAQHFQYEGYVNTLGSATYSDNNLQSSNNYYNLYILQRNKLKWYATNHWTLGLEFFNQLLLGDVFRTYNAYQLKHDDGAIDLKTNWYEKKHNILNTQIDRLYTKYTDGDFEVKIGRQRINWGRTLIWNPNDLFNTFSLYNLNYPERPGADALHITYYQDMASSSEFVVSVNDEHQWSFAANSKWNIGNYDVQLIGGYMRHSKFVIGTGWEGDILGAGFRGEASYYIPHHRQDDEKNTFLATISIDYTFNQKWYVQTEFLYNDHNHLLEFGQLEGSLYSAPTNSSSLSFSEFNLLGSIRFQATPLITYTLTSIYYPDQEGYYFLPEIAYSLSNNLSLKIDLQYFHLKNHNLKQQIASLYLGVKWNF